MAEVFSVSRVVYVVTNWDVFGGSQKRVRFAIFAHRFPRFRVYYDIVLSANEAIFVYGGRLWPFMEPDITSVLVIPLTTASLLSLKRRGPLICCGF